MCFLAAPCAKRRHTRNPAGVSRVWWVGFRIRARVLTRALPSPLLLPSREEAREPVRSTVSASAEPTATADHPSPRGFGLASMLGRPPDGGMKRADVCLAVGWVSAYGGQVEVAGGPALLLLERGCRVCGDAPSAHKAC